MPEALMMFEVGDRFGTITKEGRVQVYQVSEHGHPVAVGPVSRAGGPVPAPEVGFGGTRPETGRPV